VDVRRTWTRYIGAEDPLVGAELCTPPIILIDGGDSTDSFEYSRVVDDSEESCLSSIREGMRYTDRPDVIDVKGHVRVNDEWHWLRSRR
jgi:hypothetical protein